MKNKIMKSCIPLIIICCLISCSSRNENAKVEPNTVVVPAAKEEDSYNQQKVVDIMLLIKQTPEQIRKVLGPSNKVINNPTDCADPKIRRCIEMHYKKDSITILYTTSKLAYWFEFDKLNGHRFTKLPQIFGLPEGAPTEKKSNYVWFQNYNKIKNISFVHLDSDPSLVVYAIVEADLKDFPMNIFR
jgi:hypothetical protein